MDHEFRTFYALRDYFDLEQFSVCNSSCPFTQRRFIIGLCRDLPCFGPLHVRYDMDDDFTVMQIGLNLSLAKARAMKNTLSGTACAEELEKRLMLAGFFENRSVRDERFLEEFAAQLIFLIENYPTRKIHQFLFFSHCSTAYNKVKRRWMNVVNSNPNNLEVLDNAASFCSLWSPRTAEKIYLQAESIDSNNPHWAFALAEFYLRHAKCKISQRDPLLNKAVNTLERLFSILEERGCENFRLGSLNTMLHELESYSNRASLSHRIFLLTNRLTSLKSRTS